MSRSVGWFDTDVSGLCMGPIFKGQAAQEAVQASPWTVSSSLTDWPLKMGPIWSPETSVPNQPTLRNIPEDGRIQVNRSGSLRSVIMAS
jgi:hypothetical protein